MNRAPCKRTLTRPRLLDRLQMFDELRGALDDVIDKQLARFSAGECCIARNNAVARVIGDIDGRIDLEPFEHKPLQVGRLKTDELAAGRGDCREVVAIQLGKHVQVSRRYRVRAVAARARSMLAVRFAPYAVR